MTEPSSHKTKRPKQGALAIDGSTLRLEDVEDVAMRFSQVSLSEAARGKVIESRKRVEGLLDQRELVYGITTGFGNFKDVYIPVEERLKLQKNLLLSHAAGVGKPFDQSVVRAMLLLRANALAKGYSGVRLAVVQGLIDLLNARLHPNVPQQGSVGASGDLAPLAHLALVLIGEGEAEFGGKKLSGKEALKAAGLKPLTLEAKEGLALVNGTQAMAALGCLIVLEAERLCQLADIIGAMSLEALLGSAKAFAEEFHLLRPHPGQIASAANLRALLADSELIKSHADCGMVQDAYSLRCMPQVHGATRQAVSHLRQILEIEINAATDNPLIFDDAVLSGGNFHGQPLAIAMDYLAIALSELANISERRTERLLNPSLSNGLPAFLTEDGGLNSGLMVGQYTAAALVSENKSLAHPASVDSIPTSANQEDHVSMGTIAARKAGMILENVRKVLAIELISALQGLDFRVGNYKSGKQAELELELAPGQGVKAAYFLARKSIGHLFEDREIHKDIDLAESLLASGKLLGEVKSVISSIV
ncbi:MAG: histidine ammonia-lyase [Candidatus Melainabacteria bacterium]|nr:MAG: histidine ammonia-lyase [Candidatus Melainabacteria bacterium]